MFAYSDSSEKFARCKALSRTIRVSASGGATSGKARERPERMAKLIRTHLGNGLQEAEPTLTIKLRSGTRWNDGQPEHVEYTAQEIEALVGIRET